MFDLRNDVIFKAATALAGGGSRSTDGSCGAYIGALLFFGSVVGRDRNNLGVKNFRSQELGKTLHDMFINEYGSVICRNIQMKKIGRSYYILDPDERDKFMAVGVHDLHCTDIVGKAASWAAKIILDAGILKEPKLK